MNPCIAYLLGILTVPALLALLVFVLWASAHIWPPANIEEEMKGKMYG